MWPRGWRVGRPAAAPTLGWLYTVARRRIVDEARRRARSRTVPFELVEDPAAPRTLWQPGCASLDAPLGGHAGGPASWCLGRLIRGRSFAELGRELWDSEEACRMRFMRGLQHLREEFEKEGLNHEQDGIAASRPGVVEMLADEPELLAIADALVATRPSRAWDERPRCSGGGA